MNKKKIKDVVGNPISVGDIVFWHDPENEQTSSLYKIDSIINEETVQLSNPYGECEAYASELTLVDVSWINK